MPIEDELPPSQIFMLVVLISCVAGFASALRTQVALTSRYVGSSILIGGLTGLLTALIGYNYVRESSNIYFLVGVAGLAAYGGSALLDAALAVLIRFVGVKGSEIAGVRTRYVDVASSSEVKRDKE